MTIKPEDIEITAAMAEAARQKVARLERLINAILPRLACNSADKEVILTLLLAELHERHADGLRDAIGVIDQIADSVTVSPQTSRSLTVVSKALQELIKRNQQDHEKTIHTW